MIYAIVPFEANTQQIFMTQARMKAKRIIQQTCARMALEEQTESLRSQEEMIDELASDLVWKMPRDFWK